MSDDKILMYINQDDIKEMFAKIEQNERESAKFAEMFTKYQEKKLKISDILQLGKTPYALQISGAKDLPLSMTQSAIQNALNPENIKTRRHSSGHEVDDSVIKKLPELLRTPILIIRHNDKQLRPIFDAEIEDAESKKTKTIILICHISLDKREGNYKVNRVGTLYGKNDLAMYIKRAFENGKVVAINKQKAELLLDSIGTQCAKEVTAIGFNNSIAYSTANVKYPEQKSSTKITTNSVNNDENKPKKPNGGASGDSEGGDTMALSLSPSEAGNDVDLTPNEDKSVANNASLPKEGDLSGGKNSSNGNDGTVTNNDQTPKILNSANTYSGKENNVMEKFKAFAQDNRSLTQWLDEYEAQKKEVEEKCLDQISSTEDYEALPDADRQLLDTHNAGRDLLIESRLALDYVTASTSICPSDKDSRIVECWSLMNSTEEFANAFATLTNNLDVRMQGAMKQTRETSPSSRYIPHSLFGDTMNAPLMSVAIRELLVQECETEKTVADLVKVINLTEKQRANLYISRNNVIDEAMCATTNDTEKRNKLYTEDVMKETEAPEIVESNDGYVMNTSAPSPETNRAVSEKVTNGNEVVHNEAPRATTVDPAKVGGNVKLEEARDIGNVDNADVAKSNSQSRTEDNTPAKSKTGDGRDDI